jgi:hypothetical protein
MSDNTINIQLPAAFNGTDIDALKMKKMAFLYNAVETGWTVKKKDGSYVFTKRHEDKKEIFSDSYLRQFIEENMDINLLFRKK